MRCDCRDRQDIAGSSDGGGVKIWACALPPGKMPADFDRLVAFGHVARRLSALAGVRRLVSERERLNDRTNYTGTGRVQEDRENKYTVKVQYYTRQLVETDKKSGLRDVQLRLRGLRKRAFNEARSGVSLLR